MTNEIDNITVIKKLLREQNIYIASLHEDIIKLSKQVGKFKNPVKKKSKAKANG